MPGTLMFLAVLFHAGRADGQHGCGGFRQLIYAGYGQFDRFAHGGGIGGDTKDVADDCTSPEVMPPAGAGTIMMSPFWI